MFVYVCSLKVTFHIVSGESTPVVKTAIPRSHNLYVRADVRSNMQHSGHVIFCGTRVVKATGAEGESVRAVVIRTGE